MNEQEKKNVLKLLAEMAAKRTLMQEPGSVEVWLTDAKLMRNRLLLSTKSHDIAETVCNNAFDASGQLKDYMVVGATDIVVQYLCLSTESADRRRNASAG